MTKLALATQHFNQLDDLLQRKIETLPFELVDRAICEKVGNGWMQLIPYSSISCYDPNNGDLKFVAYQRAEGSGEQRLVESTSIGFGGHIDNVADLTCTRMETLENGSTVYHMTMQDLLTSALEACKREWSEEIGFDPITEFGIDVHTAVRFTFFRDPEDTSAEAVEKNDPGQVHFGVSIPLTLTPEQMVSVYEKAKIEEREIKDLKEFVIQAGNILMSFDVSEVASKIIKNMTEEHKIEPWSVQVISQRLLEYFEMIRAHVSYQDIILAVKKNVDAMRAQAEAQQQAAQEAAAAQAQQAGDEAAGIQDVEVKDVARDEAGEAVVEATPKAE